MFRLTPNANELWRTKFDVPGRAGDVPDVPATKSSQALAQLATEAAAPTARPTFQCTHLEPRPVEIAPDSASVRAAVTIQAFVRGVFLRDALLFDHLQSQVDREFVQELLPFAFDILHWFTPSANNSAAHAAAAKAFGKNKRSRRGRKRLA